MVAAAAMAGQAYRSPYCVVPTPDGKAAYVSDTTANAIATIDPAKGQMTGQWAVPGGPKQMVLSPDGKTLYVALYDAGTVGIVNTANGKVAKQIKVGMHPEGLALAPKLGRLFVCNTVQNTVTVIDVKKQAVAATLQAVREPMFAAVTPDESRVVVTNALATGPATESSTSATVNIYDAKALKPVAAIRLPGGSTNCRQVVISPDGKWAYLVHTVSRFQVPTTQLERGWMNTHALSVIDVANGAYYATMLLDSIDLGAADPFGLALTKDGKVLWVSLSGPHEVARIEVARLVEMLGGKIPDQYAKPLGSANSNPWAIIKKDPAKRTILINDLMAMYFADLIERYPTTGKRLLFRPNEDLSWGKGPHLLALAPDEKTLLVPNYYGGTVSVMDTANGRLLKRIDIGKQPEADLVRRGESIFHDASLCFQHWQSCSTCHPRARMDGLRWDLLNDGMGNHKKTRSLVKSHQTSPVMSMGVRAKAEVAVAAGFHHILFAVVPDETKAAVNAYLKAIEPEPSPFLLDGGKLSQAAERGKAIFEGKGECANCHTGPLYTDMKPYDVGTLGEYDRKGNKFYTPKLIELHRVAPYLHDGRAATLKEVITSFNPKDLHGITSKLSDKEVDDLVAYLKSL
jgi:YVTN family beta-propeller protein